jgi:pectinesterase
LKAIIIILLSWLTLCNGYSKDIKITVAKDGSGDYRTVQEAINSVPINVQSVTKINLSASKKIVKLLGENVEKTILTFDDFAQKKNRFGEEMGTSGSAAFYIYGDDFSAENITFENSAGPVGQAVALWVASDRAHFIRCRMLGFQDTLYTFGQGARQFYEQCYIEGTVDFIFGSATAVFKDCSIFCKNQGYITAASTPDTAKYGYIFLNCKISGAAGKTTYLGRPWRPNAKVVFINCELSEVVRPEGWNNWGKESNQKTAFYAEYNNRGPGAQPEKRVSWSHRLTEMQAKTYTLHTIFGDWSPANN